VNGRGFEDDQFLSQVAKFSDPNNCLVPAESCVISLVTESMVSEREPLCLQSRAFGENMWVGTVRRGMVLDYKYVGFSVVVEFMVGTVER
jgi:hypothetical protein